MQDPNTITSRSRKPWYKKAIEMTTLWKTIFKSPPQNASLWKSLNTSSDTQSTSSSLNKQNLRRCTSLKVATSFTRVCLCAPISYTEVFTADAPPRRSYSYPRSSNYSKPLHTTNNNSTPHGIRERVPSARLSVDGRRVFRGKSLTDDVLMRRFVVEEEAMMQVRRRNQMEIIRKRAALRRRKIGFSPLSRMVIAEDLELSC